MVVETMVMIIYGAFIGLVLNSVIYLFLLRTSARKPARLQLSGTLALLFILALCLKEPATPLSAVFGSFVGIGISDYLHWHDPKA
ncbi:MAG TPA: hypothetical protein P5080_00925 [Candidatus Paceibacterota bacterium]|nr:hypothetical protein [Candidatus Pacearchaeota archaeon]HRZ50538.1 hypothetical protein [Candidatus Paceibacterota bacterium]HSA36259.1 hypothetical protein [Candidatus Paceibacterota bacterium]